MARLARDSYRQDLEKIANTPARQEIWRLCDGSLSNEEIACQELDVFLWIRSE